MTVRKSAKLALLSASSIFALATSPASAQEAAAPSVASQPAPQPASQNEGLDEYGNALDSQAIVITGQRERGAVVGDVKPIEQYDAGDIRALGVSSISELLTELGPQVESASGKPPVMLLEGHRMSSPREVASLPSEAIERVDILPEEVGLRYGYGADQKVVNIVLRQRFRAVTGETFGRVPTRGGALSGNAELGFLSIRSAKRFNIGAELQGQQSQLESERGLTGPDSAFRTLTPSDQKLTINSTYNRPLTDRLQGTINGEVTTDLNKAAIGRALSPVLLPASSPYSTGMDSFFTPTAGGIGALERTTNQLTGHLSFGLTRDHSKGTTTLTGNYDHSFTRTISDRAFDLTSYAEAVAAGDPLADPDQDLAPQFLVGPGADVSRSYTDTAAFDLIHNTSLLDLPAGEVSLTTHVSGTSVTFSSNRLRDSVVTLSRVHRDTISGSVNLSVPIAGRGTALSDAIGSLSANFDANVDHLSDAGTIHGFGAGLNWQPARSLGVIFNYTKRETAATPQQLGDSPVVTANVPIFDYVRGETVYVTTISGGNPNLASANENNFRLGLNWSPLKDPQLGLTLDLTHNQRTGGISSLPGITLATQMAFADRFTRDDDGMLTQVDLTPINIAEQKSTRLRWGINFTKQLKTPQREIQAFQEVARKRIEERIASGQIPPEVAARFRQAMQAQNGQQAGQTGNAATANAATANAGQAAAGSTPQAGGEGAQGAADGQSAANAQGQQTQSGGNAPEIVVNGRQETPPPAFTPPPGGFRGPPGGFGGPPGGFRGPPGGFGGFGGGRGGAPRGGRINFAVYHTYLLDSTTQLSPSLPVLDLLSGETLGGGAGPSRHELQVQSGYTQGGVGFRMFANWKSATRAIGQSGTPESNLRFGSLTTVNFRLFVNFSQMPKLVDKVPFLRGSRLIFGANNVLDTHQKVTDGTGATPYSYSGPFVDRSGRSITIGFRKLFF